jgi:hypothetical protein
MEFPVIAKTEALFLRDADDHTQVTGTKNPALARPSGIMRKKLPSQEDWTSGKVAIDT